MQNLANAHNAARRMGGGGSRPSIKQKGALEPLKQSRGLTVSAQRVKAPEKAATPELTTLPPINPQANRELEALKARVAQLAEDLASSREETAAERSAGTAEHARANALAVQAQRLGEVEAAARARVAELEDVAARAAQDAAQLRMELERAQGEAAQAVSAGPCLECEQLRARSAALEQHVAHAAAEREGLEQAAAEGSAGAAELRAQVAALQAQLEQTTKSIAEAQAGRADSDAQLVTAVVGWKDRVDSLEADLASNRSTSEQALRKCKSELLASEHRVKDLISQINQEQEKENVHDIAELETLRDKVRRLEDAGKQRDRSSAKEVSQLEKRIEELVADVRAKQSKLHKLEGELRSSIASTDREANFLSKMEAQFEDDSYEAVLLEELGEMRTRFQEKLDTLSEQCNDVERRCRAEVRIERDGWEHERQGLESRCLVLSQKSAQLGAELDRLRK